MTTASQARAAVRARIETGSIVDAASNAVPLRWQNEDGGALPDTPAAFVYTEFLADPAQLVSFGSGVGGNTYRNPARVDSYVFVPKGEGLDQAESIAEQIAILFRSYRTAEISCFEATVYPGGDGASIKPPGLSSEVDNYFWAVCEVSLFFDQVG